MSKHNQKDPDCSHLLGSLSEYVDGMAEATICAEIEQHVGECENCRIVVDTLKKTIYLYHETADPPDMPAEVRSRLFKRLELDEYINPANGQT